MRLIHRYLGFFLSGIMLVYALSGIMLIFRDTDTFKREVLIEKSVAPQLEPNKIGPAIGLRNLKISEEKAGIFYFRQGTYNSTTGKAQYTKMQLPYVLDKLAHFHKAKTGDPLFFLNIFFGLGLLFFVISSFWMFLPQTSVFKKGVYFSLAGVVLALVLLFV
ncbi:hypothetical protein [Croceiramulus getboli]|nr:PepSY domain-containing protein [Flavobacteriaceae bacterium YJPT1-3]